MRKFMLAAGLAVLLSGCGDDGIYGNYVNQQYGVRLDVRSSSEMAFLLLKAGMKAKSLSISLELKTKI
ncbi:TPA: hypothetical protein ACHOXM_005068 [Escherichia coli]